MSSDLVMSISLKALFNILLIDSIALLHLSNNVTVSFYLVNTNFDSSGDRNDRVVDLEPSMLFDLFESKPQVRIRNKYMQNEVSDISR